MQSPGTTSINHPQRKPQVCILGSAEPGSPAYALAGEAGALLARLGITVVSGCGSPATRVAAECAVAAGGLVISIIPQGDMPAADWPAGVVIPCGMGDARNLLMALAWAGLFKLALLMPPNAYSLPLIKMSGIGIGINLALMVLNLLPLPPLDGGRIAVSLLPQPLAMKFAKLERWGFVILLALLFFHVLDYIMWPFVRLLTNLIVILFQLN